MASSKKSKNGDAITLLKDIMKNEIRINEEDRKRNVAIILKFVENLICVLRERDATFKLLYKRTHPTGSSFEGLRIADANEYDVDIVLKFPIQNLQVDYSGGKPSFAKYKLRGTVVSESHAQLTRLFIESGYLLPEKVRSWMQSIISKVDISTVSKIQHVRRVYLSASGPAKTFKILTDRGYEISLDFVPVIEFPPTVWPQGAKRCALRSFHIPEDKWFWFMVPKEYSGSSNDEKTSIADKHRLWRMHFPGVEKEIIHDRGCVKPVIKLLKLLRDKQRWDFLCSYYLKTIVMWEVLDHRNDSEWNESLMPNRLLGALRRLLRCLEEKKLQHILFQNSNLLEKAGGQLVANTYNRLKRILIVVEDDFTKIRDYLC